jgi:hypothetical protein
MLRWRVSTEDGSSSLEFIVAGMILLVPLVYLVLAMSAIQGGALAVEGASRQAARVYVQADNKKDAAAAAEAAIAVALADYGLDASDARVHVDCKPKPRACLTRQGFVTVTVSTTISLPLMPPVLALGVPAGVPVSAVTTEQVSRFTEAEQ